MKYRFIEDHRDRWPVRTQCRVLSVSPGGYYDWRGRAPSDRRRRRGRLAERIERIHADSRGAYGGPRVHAQLKDEGERVAPKTVAAIMREGGLRGKSPCKRKPRTTDSAHGKPVAENLLQRDFTAAGPDQKWVADLTCIDTDEGWLYLAVVLDVLSRRVVDWAAADHMRSELVEEALTTALLHRGPTRASDHDGLIHHSDRGSQYASGSFRKLLADHGIACSMSRKGDCYDNAMMESFFGTLKTELDEPLVSRAAARLALLVYIEVFYNRQRLHSALDYKSPAAYEQQHQVA